MQLPTARALEAYEEHRGELTSCFPILLQALRIGGCRGWGQWGHPAWEENAAMWVQEDLV